MEKIKQIENLDDDILEKFFDTLIDIEKLNDPATPPKEKRKIQQKIG